jgi:hypothetical protein
MHFATDSYYHLFASAEAYDISGALSRANYTAVFLRWVQLSLGFNIVLDQRLVYIITMLFIAISITIVARLFIDKAKSKQPAVAVAINLSCVLIFVNPFVMEFLLFPECAIYVAAGSLCVAISVWLLNKKKLSSMLLSTLFLILALGAYQAYLGVYFAVASSMVWLDVSGQGSLSKTFNRFLANWLPVFFIGGIAALFQFAFMKVHAMFFAATNTYGTISLNLAGISENLGNLLRSQTHYFEWALGTALFVPFCIILVIALVILVVLLKRLSYQQWIMFFVFCAASYACVFAPHAVAAIQWVPFRSVFGFWAVIACFFLLPPLIVQEGRIRKNPAMPDSFDKSDSSESDGVGNDSEASNKGNRSRLFLPMLPVALSVTMLLAVFVVITDLAIDNCITVENDALIASEINARIIAYERESGIQVTTISNRGDEIPTRTYSGVRYTSYESNNKAIRVTWSLAEILNYYGDSQLVYETMDQAVFEQYFEGKNWDLLNLDEQLVFEGDHVYLCNF